MIVIFFADPKTDLGKQRRGIDRRVDTRQRPCPDKALPRRDHPQKQEQDHRADGITVNGGQRPRQPLHLALRQAVFQVILQNQAEQQKNDDPHRSFKISADVAVNMHDEGQQHQQRQRGKDSKCFHIVSHQERFQSHSAFRIARHRSASLFMLLFR